MSQVTGQTLLNTLLEKLDVQLSGVAVNFYVNLLDGLLEGGASSQALAQNLANAPEIRAHLEAQGATTPLAQVNLLAESVSETIADLDDGETPAISFSLTESTEADAEADAEASVASATATSGTLASVETVSVTIGEGDDAQTITVEEIDASAGAAALVDALNADEAFAEAGLEAAYDNGTLTITDAQGRQLSDVQLLDGGAEAVPSTVEIAITEGVLVGAETLKLTLAGEEIELEISGANQADIVASIETELDKVEVEDEDGNVSKPFGNVEADWENGKLTITDPAGREFGVGSVELLDGGDAATESTVSIAVTNTQSLEVAQVELVINGETVTVEASGSGRAALATSLTAQLALVKDADGETIYDNITVASEGGNLVLTDDKGREFSSVRLLDEGDGAVASTASFSLTAGQARLDVGRFSITIGDEEVSLAAINVNDETGTLVDLRNEIIDAIDGADGLTASNDPESDAQVIVSVSGNTVTITDTQGREISNVFVGTAGDDVEASTATVASASFAKTDIVRISVDGETYEIARAEDDAALTTIGELVDFINNAVDEEGEAILPAGVTATADVDDEDNDILVITDANGRELSDVELVDVDDAVPSTVTINGLTDSISSFDAGRFSATLKAEGEDAVTIVVEVDGTDTATLATAIQTAFADTGVTGVSAEANEAGTAIVITDADGREMSNVSLTQEGDEATASVTTLFGVVVPSADKVANEFSATVQYVGDDGVLREAEVGPVDLSELTSITAIIDGINGAFDGLDQMEAGTIVASYDEETLQLKITNEQGYTTSDVEMTAVESEGDDDGDFAEEIVVTQAGTPAGEDAAQVGSTPAIENGIEANSDDREALGEVSIVSDLEISNGNIAGAGSVQVGSDPVIENGSTAGGNAAVVVETAEGDIENGNEAGTNPNQLGDAPVVDNGSIEGLEPQLVAEVTVENGTEATEASAWTATLALESESDELAEAYTFTLSLTEVLGEDAEEGAEAAVFEFSVEAEAGATLADVTADLAAAIDADEAFAASVNDEGQLVVEAAELGVNYEAAAAVELVAVEEPQIVEAA